MRLPKRNGRFALISGPKKIKKRVPSASFSSEEADGYYVMKDGVRIYTVHAAAMRKWLATDPKQFDRLLDWLDAEGILMRRQSRTDKAGSDWAIQTPKWPNGKSVRSIVFRDPFQPVTSAEKRWGRRKRKQMRPTTTQGTGS